MKRHDPFLKIRFDGEAVGPGKILGQQGQLQGQVQNQQQGQVQNQQQGQQQQNQSKLTGIDPQVFNRPGRNLLQLNQDSNGPVSVVSDSRFRGNGNTGFVRPNDRPVGTQELDNRIVTLSNGGTVKIGQNSDRDVNLPRRKVETFTPRQFSQNQISQNQSNFQPHFDQRTNGISSRPDLVKRLNDGGGGGGGGGNFGGSRQNFSR